MRKTSMLQRILGIAFMMGIGLAISTVSLGAEDAVEAPAEGSDSSWHFDMKSWIWLMGVEGTVGVGPLKIDANADFGDILEASDSLLAFSGRVEAGVGPLTGFVDGLWARIGADDRSGPAGISRVDVTQEMGIVDFGLMYRIYDGALLGDLQPDAHHSTINVYGGARYMTLTLELDPAMLSKRSADKDWIDPIIGVKLTQPLTDRLHLEIWGDIGGFGASSDLTWSATAVLGYDVKIFNLPMTFYVGYRAIGWDFSDGSGLNEFQWDVILHGPTVGMTIWF